MWFAKHLQERHFKRANAGAVVRGQRKIAGPGPYDEPLAQGLDRDGTKPPVIVLDGRYVGSLIVGGHVLEQTPQRLPQTVRAADIGTPGASRQFRQGVLVARQTFVLHSGHLVAHLGRHPRGSMHARRSIDPALGRRWGHASRRHHVAHGDGRYHARARLLVERVHVDGIKAHPDPIGRSHNRSHHIAGVGIDLQSLGEENNGLSARDLALRARQGQQTRERRLGVLVLHDLLGLFERRQHHARLHAPLRAHARSRGIDSGLRHGNQFLLRLRGISSETGLARIGGYGDGLAERVALGGKLLEQPQTPVNLEHGE